MCVTVVFYQLKNEALTNALDQTAVSCKVYASSIEDIRDRCEIEGQQSGRDLTQLAPGACNSACGHSETARVCPHPLMGPGMASVAAQPM